MNTPLNFSYYNQKPDSITFYNFLFDANSNDKSFGSWVRTLIWILDKFSRKTGWTFFKRDYLSKLIGKSTRTLSTVLQDLVDVGAINVKVVKGNKRYHVNYKFLSSYTISNNSVNNPIAHATSYGFSHQINITPVNAINYITPENPEYSIGETFIEHDHDYHALSSNIPTDNFLINKNISENEVISDSPTTYKEVEEPPSNLITLNEIEATIKKDYENLSGRRINLSKEITTLKEIAKKPVEVIRLAFSNIKNYVSTKNIKLYSLSYLLRSTENLINKLKQHKSTGLSQPAKQNRQNTIKVLTPAEQAEQLELKQQLAIAERNEQLKTDFYNDLPDEIKAELIQQEIASIQTEPTIWQKLKPKWPWFDDSGLKAHAVNRIKDYLLKEYLEYQEFLAIPATS